MKKEIIFNVSIIYVKMITNNMKKIGFLIKKQARHRNIFEKGFSYNLY